MRHSHGSRIEAFSDAVFGFALTLLVVSLEVPTGFAGLRATFNARFQRRLGRAVFRFALLHAHPLRRRHELELDQFATFDARTGRLWLFLRCAP